MLNEMTNEELAKFIERVTPYFEDRFLTEFHEVATRLRKMDAMEMALNIEVGMNMAAAEMTVKQKRMLSAMEKRLKMLADSGSSNPDWYRYYAREVLEAMRENN